MSYGTTIPLDLDSSIPLYLQLKLLLLARIEAGQWKPGERMPGDDELVKIHQISRTTVRQAMKELEIAGLIIRYRGRGTFLTSPKLSHSPDPPHRLTDNLGAQGIQASWRVLKSGMTSAPAGVAAALRIDMGAEVFRTQRLRLAGDEVIGVVTAHALVNAEDIASQALERGPSLQYLASALSLVGARVERVIEAVSAVSEVAIHLEIEVGAPVLLVRRILNTAAGDPIEHYRAAYRGDRFQFMASNNVHEIETRGDPDEV